jgi:hypothetical protein
MLRWRRGLRAFPAGDSYPLVETVPEIPNRPKNPSRERKRAVSLALATLPLSVRIPRANIAARSERCRCGLGCGRQPAPGIFASESLLTECCAGTISTG